MHLMSFVHLEHDCPKPKAWRPGSESSAFGWSICLAFLLHLIVFLQNDDDENISVFFRP